MKIKSQSIKLLALILFSFFSIYNGAIWGASFSYVIIPFVLFIIAGILDPSYLKINKSLFSIFIIYIVYFFSTCISNYVSIGRDFVSFLLFCVLYVIAVSFVYSEKELKTFILCYIFIGFTVSCNICIQWITHHYMQVWLNRSSFYFLGHFKDPNYTMAYVAPSVVLSIMILFYSNIKRIRILMIINIAVAFFSCILASSRSGVIAIGLSVVAMILFSKRISRFTKSIIIVFVIIIISVGRYFIFNTYNEYALNRILNDTDGGGRIEIWSCAIEVFLQNPFLGGGLNSGSELSLATMGYTTHSIIIDIICDSGVFGTIAILAFIYSKCIKCNKANREFFIILSLSCFVPMFFINGFNTTTIFYPIIMMSIFRNYSEKSDFSLLLGYKKTND